jgi:hypothetical protein
MGHGFSHFASLFGCQTEVVFLDVLPVENV